MFNKFEVKISVLKLVCAASVFTILSVSYTIVPDNTNCDFSKQGIDCTGLLASQQIQNAHIG